MAFLKRSNYIKFLLTTPISNMSYLMHEISDNVQERAENFRPRLGSAVGIGVGVILEALSPSGVQSMTAGHHCRIGFHFH